MHAAWPITPCACGATPTATCFCTPACLPPPFAENGAVWTFGSNANGQCGIGVDGTDQLAVAQASRVEELAGGWAVCGARLCAPLPGHMLRSPPMRSSARPASKAVLLSPAGAVLG
jgi:hypothetical protein